MKAILRKSQISYKKANLVASLVRGKKVDESLHYLRFLPKKAASILKDVVQSAAANAENNFGQDRKKLYIKTILVNQGPTQKRFMPISRGRVHPIRKRTSHITVELDLIPNEADAKTKAKISKAKSAEKKVAATETKKTTTPKNTTEKKTNN